MAITINADTTNGLVMTPDTSGEISFQSAGVTVGSVTSNGFQDVNGNALSGYAGPKNLIINGNMQIAQRGTSAFTVNSTSAQFPVDRFYGEGQNSDGVFTVQQSTTAPSDFVNSMVATVTTADASIGASQYYLFSQHIEGLNTSHLRWGTASAKTVTLSFWVRSSITGTFGGVIANSAQNRCYPYTYTISSADTWEQKSVTIPGDTSGTWLTTNGVGLTVRWSIGAGSSISGTPNTWGSTFYGGATGQTNLIATNGATLYLTGVQLEVGSNATNFEHIPFDMNLARCQRYYQICRDMNQGYANAIMDVGGRIIPSCTMRANPTITSVPAYAGRVNNSYTYYWVNPDGIGYYHQTTSAGNYYWYTSFLLSSEL